MGRQSLEEFVGGFAARGKEIGVKYGEAFRQHSGHPYAGDNRLAELLGIRT